MTTIDLSNLDGTAGFTLQGVTNGDNSGYSVSLAGDINGDGFEDLIVGAYGYDPGDPQEAGETYVVFGQEGGFPAFFSLGGLNGGNGFRIQNYDSDSFSGRSVHAAGDINGDGFADLIIGAPARASDGVNDSGESFIVFGTNAGFAAVLELSTLDATQGVSIQGGNVLGDYTGESVGGRGDFNGDGFDDVIVGSPFDDANAADAGASFVIFGDSALGAQVDAAALNGLDGARIEGVAAGDRAGQSVANAGDVNGDGIDDMIIGAPNADYNGSLSGEAYVIFGKEGGIGAFPNVSDLDGTDGFRIGGAALGDLAGSSVSAAGDVNGDGFGDIIIGAPNVENGGGYYGYDAGRAYVIFGSGEVFDPVIDLNDVFAANGNGFQMSGYDRYGAAGSAVSGGGDINGDGFDDVIVGARGVYDTGGEAYVVFGRSTFNLDLELATLADADGIIIQDNTFAADTGTSVSIAGDFNSDGLDDILVGQPKSNTDTGQNFLVRGFANAGVIDQLGGNGDENLVGATARDVIVGGLGDDVIDGLGGNDTLGGGGGDDILAVTDLTFQRLDGGIGEDTVRLDAALTLDLTALGDQGLRDIEAFDLNGANSSIILDDLSVLALSETSNTAKIDGDATSSLILADEGDWTAVRATNAVVTLQNGAALIEVSTDVNFAAVFQGLPIAEFDLAALDGADGFRLEGPSSYSDFGAFVSDAGDVNGDGFEDFIVGAPESTVGGVFRAGEAFIVFGSGAPFNPEILVQDLNGADGFRFVSEVAYDRVGVSVGAAGDLNGDGFADVVVGSYGGYYNSGETYVLFGSDQAFPADVTSASLDGANGFSILGTDNQDRAGVTVDGAGDINGDGFDDIIIGAVNADPQARFRAGESYVVFGTDAGFAASIDVAALDGSNGFAIQGGANYDYTGKVVSSAGDINGDGFADMQITDANGGGLRIVFGSNAPFGAALDLGALDGTQGFTVSGANASSINHAGDINGDGFADFVIGDRAADLGGADTGSGFVVFGQNGGLGVNLDLGTLDGSNGFRLDGITIDGFLGTSVAGAGDVNGDGFDDLIFGAPGSNGDGGAYAADSVVLFGKAAGFGAVESAGGLDGTDGFRIVDADDPDFAGSSVSSAGDVNGDGFDDLLVGAPNGYSLTYGQRPGESYIIFGGDNGAVTLLGDATDETLNGGAGADIIVGGAGDDTLIGNGGIDVLRGGAGDDILDVQDLTFQRVVGGTGIDSLGLVGDNLDLDLTAPGNQRIEEIEDIFLAGTGNSLTVDLASVANLSNTSNDLLVSASVSGDLTVIDAGWQTVVNDGTTRVLQNGGVTLTLDNTITLAIGNIDPVAADDAFAVDEDQAIIAGDIRIDNGNGADADADGDVLLHSLVTDVANGVLIFVGDGTFDYTPDADFNGTDSFVYQVDDGKGGADTATVTLTVNPVNDDPVAQDDAFTVLADNVLNGDVLADNGNGVDFDIDLDSLNISSIPVVDVVNGTLLLDFAGGFTYTPDIGFVGTDTFTYELQDGLGGTDTAVVNITVAPDNAAPLPQDDDFTLIQGGKITGNVFADNGNGIDIDPDGDNLSLLLNQTTETVFGVLRIKANGNFTYDADNVFVGTDTFSYTVTDGNGETATATVRFDVQPDLTGVLQNSGGNDVFKGGVGTVLTYGEVTSGRILADLKSGFIGGGGDVGLDRAINIFEIRATDFDDVLFGSDVGVNQPYILLGAFESFEGLAGDDIIFAAAGLDRMSYVNSQGAVDVNLLEGITFDDGFGDQDTLFGVEGLRGTNGDDSLVGDNNDNFFQPLRGEDLVDGSGGDDLLLYEGLAADLVIDLKNEQVSFANGDITVIKSIENVETNAGDDTILGNGASNKFAAGLGVDLLVGGGGSDTLFGEEGNDKLFGNSGSDILHGGAGNDALSGASGADEIVGGIGDDTAIGGNGGDRIMGNAGADRIFGQNGADKLFGNGGADLLDGGAGNDSLGGAGGDDIIAGGLGNDVMSGGSAADRFVFDTNSGIDTICDFAIGLDLIDVVGVGITNFAEIEAILDDVNGRAVISFDAGVDVLRLNGVASNDLSAGDFIFANSDL